MNLNMGDGDEQKNNLQMQFKSQKTNCWGFGNVDVASNVLTKFLSSKAVGIFGVNVVNQLLARANGEILNQTWMCLRFNSS